MRLLNYACLLKSNLHLSQQRKSVGVDLNWGVRLQTLEEVRKVLGDLATELSARMHRANVKGTHLTCKVDITYM